MNLKSSQTKVTAVFTISVGSILASMTAADAAEWLEVVTQFSPIALCGWLLYVLYRLESQHGNCQRELLEVHAELGELKAKVAALEAASLRDTDDGH